MSGVNMNFVPSYKTAVIAGLITSVGMTAYSFISVRLGIEDKNGVLWFLAAAAFFLLPIYFLVLGHNSRPFGTMWFKDTGQRTRQWSLFKRLIAWFVSAGLVVTVCSVSGRG